MLGTTKPPSSSEREVVVAAEEGFGSALEAAEARFFLLAAVLQAEDLELAKDLASRSWAAWRSRDSITASLSAKR